MSDFKRLTERDLFGNADVTGVKPEDFFARLYGDDPARVSAVINRLAAYEDTALTPEQVTALQTRIDELTAMLGAALGDMAVSGSCLGCTYYVDGVANCEGEGEPCHRWRGYDRFPNVPEFPTSNRKDLNKNV